MSFYPSQDDINLLFQPSKQVYSKVEILNKDYMSLTSIEGRLISDSYNVDSNTPVRRTYNCTLQVTKPILAYDRNSEIWFDKYIRPYVGIYDNRKRKVIWYLKGTYSTVNANHSFDPSTNTLSLTCNDLMCRLTGDLDGKQTGLNFTIPSGEDIRTSIIGILKVFGFTRYSIEELPRRVQFDQQFSAGATAQQMIASLMEFCPNYEYFFDLDGTFVVQRIPCYTNDDDVLSDVILQRLLVSQDSYTVGFNAKNCIEVWGRSYDSESVDRFAESCTYNSGSNTYNIVLRNGVNSENQELHWDKIPDYLLFAVTIDAPNASDGCKIQFTVAGDTFGPYDVYDEYDNLLVANTVEGDVTYLFYYDVDTETIPSSEMNLTGIYNASTAYNKNDVVAYTVDEKMKTYIASEATTGATPSEGEPWREITFATAYELVGVFDSATTYQPTQMVIYNGKLYYCLKRDTAGVLPTTYNPDDPTWEELNLNVNSIKLGNRMRYRGHMTAHGIYKNETDSKFSISEMGREYWEIYSGGEYDNITSDALAEERAMYECYYKANLNEVLSLTLVDIPWLDVNKKVSYTRKLGTEAERWMISSVSSETLSGTCSVTLNKFYPDWSEVYQSDFGTKGD